MRRVVVEVTTPISLRWLREAARLASTRATHHPMSLTCSRTSSRGVCVVAGP
jgi:hypothetical protein